MVKIRKTMWICGVCAAIAWCVLFAWQSSLASEAKRAADPIWQKASRLSADPQARLRGDVLRDDWIRNPDSVMGGREVWTPNVIRDQLGDDLSDSQFDLWRSITAVLIADDRAALTSAETEYVRIRSIISQIALISNVFGLVALVLLVPVIMNLFLIYSIRLSRKYIAYLLRESR
jgi:hypothetical protein